MSLPYPSVYDFPYMSPVPSPSYCFFHLSVCPSAYLSQLACLCSLCVHLPSYSVASPYLRSLEFFSLSACLPFFLSPCLPLYLSASLPFFLSPFLSLSLSTSLPVCLCLFGNQNATIDSRAANDRR